MKASQSESRSASVLADPRWARVVARDPDADGHFVYSVRTTGVYCRPSCGSRAARPENVAFHHTARAAEQAGFRPCKRCKPNQASLASTRTQAMAQLCRYIESAAQAPSLASLARHAGMSPHHLHRVFKATIGLTPKAYVDAHRAGRVRQALSAHTSVTEAIYSAGYNSSGRFYEQADHLLGMTPSRYQSGGAGATMHFAVGACSLGAILVASSERGVCAISLGDDPDALVRELQDRFPHAHLLGGDAQYEQLVAQVVGYIEAPQIGLNLPLDVRGTAFQQRVWQALQAIPLGQTASYTDIAQRIGAPTSVRAVATACAANTLAVAIPCHRVVRQDGSLSGYRWGVERKRLLLEREAGHKAEPRPLSARMRTDSTGSSLS